MSRRPDARVGGLIGAGILAVVLWWWWPGLTDERPDERPEVGIVASGDVRAAAEPLDRRLREQGLRTEWSDEPVDWCSVPESLAGLAGGVDIAVVAIGRNNAIPTGDSTTDSGVEPAVESICGEGDDVLDLDDVAEAVVGAGPRIVVITADDIDVLGPDDEMAAALRRAGAATIDVGRLLGGVDEPMVCAWWDDCDSTGTVVTVDSAGLTDAGSQRVARTIVAGVVGEGTG